MKLPIASTTKDGITTNDAQNMAGAKTFYNAAGSTVLGGYSDAGLWTLGPTAGAVDHTIQSGATTFVNVKAGATSNDCGIRLVQGASQRYGFYVPGGATNLGIYSYGIANDIAAATSSGAWTLGAVTTSTRHLIRGTVAAGFTLEVENGSSTGRGLRVYSNNTNASHYNLHVENSSGNGLSVRNDGQIAFGSLAGSNGLITGGGAWTLGNYSHTGYHLLLTNANSLGTPVAQLVKNGFFHQTNNNIYMSFQAALGQDDGYLQTNGSAVFVAADISDARLKENIRAADYGLDTLMALRPVTFDWLARPASNVKGFIAQEVKNVLPESVSFVDKSESGGPADMHTLEMQTMIPVLVAAVQELKAIVDAQAARITVLEA